MYSIYMAPYEKAAAQGAPDPENMCSVLHGWPPGQIPNSF